MTVKIGLNFAVLRRSMMNVLTLFLSMLLMSGALAEEITAYGFGGAS